MVVMEYDIVYISSYMIVPFVAVTTIPNIAEIENHNMIMPLEPLPLLKILLHNKTIV